MFIELTSSGLFCEKQKPIKVYYDERIVGEYFTDIVVNECVIIELKAAEALVEEHELQLINYLKIPMKNILSKMLLRWRKTSSRKR